MLWFFQNGEKTIRLETKYDAAAGDFVAVIEWPDGIECIERFNDGEAFRTRLIELETQLAEQNYQQDGGPTILPEGWSNGRIRRRLDG
jgi:hypothetical protein